MDISEFISVEDAAEKLGYDKTSVTFLCRKGKLKGAVKIGGRWLIPSESVNTYVKAPQGFAAIWERRREAEKAEMEEYDIPEDVILESSETKNETKNILLEILRSQKILIKEVRELKRIIAQTN